MLDLGLIIDAYGLDHDISWLWGFFYGADDETEAVKMIEEAAWRDIVVEYLPESRMNGGHIYDEGHTVFKWEKDPNFDMEKFIDWVLENEEAIRKRIQDKEKK